MLFPIEDMHHEMFWKVGAASANQWAICCSGPDNVHGLLVDCESYQSSQVVGVVLALSLSKLRRERYLQRP